jgi:hypothetical protein
VLYYYQTHYQKKIMNQPPPKILVQTWLFLATKSEFQTTKSIALGNIELTFKTIKAAIEYAES